MSAPADRVTRAVLFLTVAGLAGGGVATLAGAPRVAADAWAATTVVALVPLTVSTLRALAAGNVGVDLIALLAMAGALALGQYLAGAVIALMLSGGNALEAFADARARRELAALVARAPRTAHRAGADGALATIDVGEVGVGDLLVVKPGEIVPVDGVVVGATAVLDESALTGESIPRARGDADEVRSGTLNAAAAPFQLRARARAADSTYAGIVRLVEEAQAAKAPLERLADRYALLFLPLTLTVAAAAWLFSGDPVRALAVLVVATPCPLILAAPVAIVSGISRAARHGIIVKGGGALETLARGTQLVLDKTGTVTSGTPVVTDVETFEGGDPGEVLRLAASLDQASAHVIALPIIRAAHERDLALTFPTEVNESLGAGIEGRVEGRRVRIGKLDWVFGQGERPPQVRRIRRRTLLEGAITVFVSIDGPAGRRHHPRGPGAPRRPAHAPHAPPGRASSASSCSPATTWTSPRRSARPSAWTACSPSARPRRRSRPSRDVKAGGVTVMVGDGINDARGARHGRRRRGHGRARRHRVVGRRRHRAGRRPARPADRRHPHRAAGAVHRACRASWPAWGCRPRAWRSPPSACSRPSRARSCRRCIDVAVDPQRAPRARPRRHAARGPTRRPSSAAASSATSTGRCTTTCGGSGASRTASTRWRPPRPARRSMASARSSSASCCRTTARRTPRSTASSRTSSADRTRRRR